jgi:murein DD-endopeptidase MepM/ murein hydrolase activator NlpD
MPGSQRPHAIAVGTFALLAVVGCHSAARPMHPVGAPGRWYVVAAGETLADVARRAGVPEEDLLEVNGLHSATEVQPGRLIFVIADQRARPQEAVALEPAPDEGPPPLVPPPKGARFRWPVDAPRITSLFGTRWGRMHEGIDLTAPIGTPVYAAAAGEVVYAGSVVRGYGNMVVLKHESDLMTVYAHNSVLLVKVGDRVGFGQRVALSGQSGRATGPHVHFEVRRREIPRDPLPYLPDLRAARERSPKS